MQTTVHIQQRMSQRGINGKMLDIVLEHGRLDKDKHVLGRKAAIRLLDELRAQEIAVKKIIDKGGMVVVSDNGALITTYNYSGRY
ncbi:hypothetical protein AQZ52_02030 [Novosphingobium fuchskuhlense]|uniref:DUF4258 domain-containing protein n=2 Tax=Novosphingobium fuchskuhlense TaxID=1117702 RepID=A0A124JW89_9SPHN|nr:hypothetical protein AQZ52_02030 [Novosphingobium fuchskuhlense]